MAYVPSPLTPPGNRYIEDRFRPPMRRRSDDAVRDIVQSLLAQREWVLKIADGIESSNLMPGDQFTREEVVKAIRQAVGEV